VHPKRVAATCIAAARTIMNKQPWNQELEEKANVKFEDIKDFFAQMIDIARELYKLRLQMESRTPSQNNNAVPNNAAPNNAAPNNAAPNNAAPNNAAPNNAAPNNAAPNNAAPNNAGPNATLNNSTLSIGAH
jgi:hypothetical protein